MRRFVLFSLLGIASLLAGSVALIEWLGRSGPGQPVALPGPVAVPAAPVAPVAPAPEQRPAVIVPPPAVDVAPALEAFLHPPPMAVPPPDAPPPTVDLARDAPAIQARVSNRCGTMQVRLGDEMRRKGEEMTGQALLLFEVEPQAGKVKFWDSQLQSPGNVRPALVACAQWALKGHVFPVPGTSPGERFTVQVVLGMKPE